jgi:hypothetical protein
MAVRGRPVPGAALPICLPPDWVAAGIIQYSSFIGILWEQ